MAGRRITEKGAITMEEKKTIKLNEEDLEKVSGGGVLNELPPVDDHDYDDDVKDKIQ